MATGPRNPSSERSSAPRRVRDSCQCAASLLAAAAQSPVIERMAR